MINEWIWEVQFQLLRSINFAFIYLWFRSFGDAAAAQGDAQSDLWGFPHGAGAVISFLCRALPPQFHIQGKSFRGIVAAKMGAEDELKLEGDGAEEAAPSPSPPPNRNPNPSSPTGPAGEYKGKSCKGCLYYSSVQKSKSQRPTCVGISRSLQQGRLFDLLPACSLFWFICSISACSGIWKWKAMILKIHVCINVKSLAKMWGIN